MPTILKRPYKPDELAEILRGLIRWLEEERTKTYSSADRSIIDYKLKGLRQLEQEQERKSRNNQLNF